MVGLLASLEGSIPALRRYAFTLLNDHNDADDVVRECLVAALNRSGACCRVAPHIWLLALVYRRSLARLRRKGVRSAPCRADANIGAAGVVRLFGSLPVELRNVLFLVSVEELSYQVVAEVVGVPVDAVMSLLSAGRERLRSLVQDEAPSSIRRTA